MIFGKPWFLSIVSGIIAIALYHFLVGSSKEKTLPPSSKHKTSRTRIYLGVFITAALLVYGSFLVAEGTGECRFAEPPVEIQTGGRPPF